MFNIAKEAAKNYTNAQERELAEIDNLLNGINKETNGEVENEDIPVYARLYTKNGTTNEVLILASSDNVFSDYSSELTLKQDFKNIYIYKPYTKEDLYEMTPYAEILNSEEWKQYEKENPEEAKLLIESCLQEANKNAMRPWIRYEDDAQGDWYNKNENLIEVRILDEIFPKTTARWFEKCYSLENIIGFENLNTTDTSGMFYNCLSLTSVDLSGMDTRNVTDMSGMFYACNTLTSVNLSGIDTRNVTDMSEMFSNCRSLTSVDLSSFNTSNVTDMSGMFLYCNSLTSVDLSGIDTRNLSDMSEMFSNCRGLTSVDLSSFNTSNVTDMGMMFEYCGNLTHIKVGSGWNDENAYKGNMFTHCGVDYVGDPT